ncbi:MAG: amidohydrolase, partial [Ktedonobacteraceae bacterium]|nr:amidohydrolase [Ktedonobacteraceae bacterium]
GGTILTLDEAQPQAEALAVQAGRVHTVGGEAEVMALRGPGTEIVNLRGRVLCPGFIDAHHHLTLAAWCQLGINLAECRSVQEIQAQLRAQLMRKQPGEWLYAYNYRPWNFHDHRRRLSRYDLDAVAGERPVLVMHFSFHEAVVSSAGLRVAGIDRQTPDPQGGRIQRDRHGSPTGELLETAVGRVEALARTAAGGTGYEDWLAALQRYCQQLFAAGITHVCDPGVDALLESYLRRARREERLPLPVSMLFISGGGLFQEPVDRLSGPLTGEQLDGLQVGALKIFADGGSRCAVCIGMLEAFAGVVSLVGRAAKLRRPALLAQSSAPERPHLDQHGRVSLGFLHYQPEHLAALCREAHGRGFQVAVHAACNAAVEGTLQAYEQLPTRGRWQRHRVEHLVSLDVRQARRLADVGAIGVVQPMYISQMGDEWEAMPTPPRLHSVPLRDLLDAGVALAGSSDAPIAPYSPLQGMQAAMTRRTSGGLIHQGQQAITALEALRLWTTGAALAANLPGKVGILCPGSRADMVMLTRNPLETPPEAWNQVAVERTFIGGQTVYHRETHTGENEVNDAHN